MGRSSYDSLIFDKKSKSTIKKITNDIGNCVEVYKNWLYVHSPKNWEASENPSFSKPIVAQIEEGRLSFAGFNIYAQKSSQSSVFFIVTWKEKNKEYVSGGIGAYSQTSPETILESLGRFNESFEDWSSGGGSDEDDYIINDKTMEKIIHHVKHEYIGISPKTLNSFWLWVLSLDNPLITDWANRCQLERMISFNQGDSYFSKKLNTLVSGNELSNTTSSPLISKIAPKMESKVNMVLLENSSKPMNRLRK